VSQGQSPTSEVRYFYAHEEALYEIKLRDDRRLPASKGKPKLTVDFDYVS